MKQRNKLYYNGEEYPSYYSLEKKMGINRKTIQYRHEKLGIPLEQVPDYVAKPPQERFGGKNIRSRKNDEIENLITYPERPNLPDVYILSNEYKKEKQRYIKWLSYAPEILLKREAYLINERRKELEQIYSETASEVSFKAKKANLMKLNVIRKVAKSRNITLKM